MRILITGVSGYIGKNLFYSLARYHKVFGLDNNLGDLSHNKSIFKADITSLCSVSKVIHQVKPDVIIHAAAINSLKKCEEEFDFCFKVNVGGTENIVKSIKDSGRGIKLIFFSSDYVFDGKKGYYSENDKVSPNTAYGRMKVEGENLVKKELGNYLIIRTANVYLRGGNFFNYLKDNLLNGIQEKYFNDAFYSPTNIDVLIIGIKRTIDIDFKGIIHMAGSERVSRYDFACIFTDVLLLDKNKLVIFAKTPKSILIDKDHSLNVEKFRKLVPDIVRLTIRESLYLEYGLFIKSYFSNSDERGSITGILQVGSWEEVNYLFSRKGFIRGNHYHKETKEVIHILKGKIKVSLKRMDKTLLKELIIKKNDTIVILPGFLHTFEILSDSRWINILSKPMVGEKKDIHIA